jgi:RimJ/RimL family protein N-acetyltransferase
MARIDPRNVLPARIATARLVLRAPIRGDVPALAKLANNPKIASRLKRLPHPYTALHALDFIERIALSDEERAYAVMFGEEQFIGIAGFHFARGANPELGYWLGEAFWGSGLATEAVRGLVDAAQRTGQFPAISARVLADNPASRRVLEKVGFAELETVTGDCGSNRNTSIVSFRLEPPRWM